jgi:hypothetical protein
MKRGILLSLVSCLYICAAAQPDIYRQEWQNSFDIAKLPVYRNDTLYQISSYDRTGGNDDGFSGQYSYLRKEGNDRIIADIRGAGMINRIWTPTPSADTILFYFDGEKQARIALPFIDLFSGKVFPFIEPLCGYEAGGYYCYLPIGFEKSVKIIYRGDNLKFHQIQYRKFPEGKQTKSFSFEYFHQNKDLFHPIKTILNRQSSVYERYGAETKARKFQITLSPGTEKPLFEYIGGGRIVEIEMKTENGGQDNSRRLKLIARWDHEKINAMDISIHDFFGYAFGQPSMQSALVGANTSQCYCRLPMPFDSSATLLLKLENDGEASGEVHLSGTVYYTENPRDKEHEGKLYVQSRREYLPETGKPYRIADIKGKGHYVGSILQAQGLEDGMTAFWEGDDRSIIDGEMRMHGTGSEDYFNGGWYAVLDRWDRGISMPLHGSLLYDLKKSRTGGYRWFISDKINFNSSYQLSIEHGPEKNETKVDYTSTAFFYADNPQFEHTHRFDAKDEIKQRYILFPQEILFKLYWYASVSFGESTMRISAQKTDSWMTNIDFEAVPIMQIDLSCFENGRYKLYVVHKGIAGGSAFAIWQRTKPVSGWIEPTCSDEMATSYTGVIEITEQLKTITLRRKKTEDCSVEIQSFIFEKMN